MKVENNVVEHFTSIPQKIMCILTIVRTKIETPI